LFGDLLLKSQSRGNTPEAQTKGIKFSFMNVT